MYGSTQFGDISVYGSSRLLSYIARSGHIFIYGSTRLGRVLLYGSTRLGHILMYGLTRLIYSSSQLGHFFKNIFRLSLETFSYTTHLSSDTFSYGLPRLGHIFIYGSTRLFPIFNKLQRNFDNREIRKDFF